MGDLECDAVVTPARMRRLHKVLKVRKLGDMKRDEIYTVAAAANRLGVHPSTLRRWDHKGILRPSIRTLTGERRYTEADLEAVRKNKEN